MEQKKHLRFFSMFFVSKHPHIGSTQPSPTLPTSCSFCSEKKRWCLDNHEETPRRKVLTAFKQPTDFCKKFFQDLRVKTPLEDLQAYLEFESHTYSKTKTTATPKQIRIFFNCFLYFCSSTFGHFPPKKVSYVNSYFSAFSFSRHFSAFQEPVLRVG